MEHLGIPHFGPSQIEKLSGDNTRVEKESNACTEDWVHTTENTLEKSVWSIAHFIPRDCKLLISTKCAGMGCDIPDIRLTVCIGGFLANLTISVYLARAS